VTQTVKRGTTAKPGLSRNMSKRCRKTEGRHRASELVGEDVIVLNFPGVTRSSAQAFLALSLGDQRRQSHIG
jgi:hypothetical protein